MKTLVLGASSNPDRYAYKAVGKLIQKGYEVIPLGVKDGELHGQKIMTNPIQWEAIDTVSLYLAPNRQADYKDYLLRLSPRRVIFNPGTENAELEQALQASGIQTEQACTLVLLSTNQY